MAKLKLHYATNRGHEGKQRFKPDGYGTKFSSDGMENLRFGKLTVEAADKTVNGHLGRATGGDDGDGNKLETYLSNCARKRCTITAYAESIDRKRADVDQANAKYGSKAMFGELRDNMVKGCDVLVYIHGFNVDWHQAVGSALTLQCMLNRPGVGSVDKDIRVILFSWPSDGSAMPFVAYKSDRAEARGSGDAFGRAMLKLRDHLHFLKELANCGQSLHLLAHSMGNYVLQNALARMCEYNVGSTLPRIFEHIFMCAPDVDEDALQPGKPLGRLHELGNAVSVYHNRGDLAMHISDYTKGHPDRLGHSGTAMPGQVHHKVQQVDCSPIVTGAVEHSYYQWGPVNRDIRQSLDGLAPGDPARRRKQYGVYDNAWLMTSPARAANRKAASTSPKK